MEFLIAILVYQPSCLANISMPSERPFTHDLQNVSCRAAIYGLILWCHIQHLNCEISGKGTVKSDHENHLKTRASPRISVWVSLKLCYHLKHSDHCDTKQVSNRMNE